MMGLNFGKLGAASGRTLAQQIAAMSPSLWLEPSVANGYQDSAGTTALYQPGNGSADPPVGKALDLSGLGNHAIQATSTARPKLSARANICDHTEDISYAGWLALSAGTGATPVVTADYAAGPVSGMTASRVQLSLGATPASATSRIYRSFSDGLTARRYKSVWMKTNDGATVSIYMQGPDSSNSIIAVGPTWSRIKLSDTAPAVVAYCQIQFGLGNGVATSTAADILVSGVQIAYTDSSYQRVTDANNYDTAGFPLIHQFDGVDDVLNVTFPSSLGSDCTVVTANRGTTPTIATGQTIGTSYTINTTNAGRLVFPRALTASETAVVTAWATQKGALP